MITDTGRGICARRPESAAGAFTPPHGEDADRRVSRHRQKIQSAGALVQRGLKIANVFLPNVAKTITRALAAPICGS